MAQSNLIAHYLVCLSYPSSHLGFPSTFRISTCRSDHADGAQGGGPGGHRGGYQAYSSMVFAQGGIPQQHVTANDMPSPETDVQRNDLAPDASLSMSQGEAGSGGMGSLTGWQALANEVRVADLPYFSAILFFLLQPGTSWSHHSPAQHSTASAAQPAQHRAAACNMHPLWLASPSQHQHCHCA